ncbi:MAG: class I SAM-dependent rRNA methyltransferase [Myxococcales bacterium]|nr:class I SAM-dependent rRNA methyltransferase [Myxococcales bacterium]
MSTVRLRAGHVQPVWAGHPWVFAQAIESVDGAPAPGDVVTVVDPRGNFLGRGYWSPSSAIPVRIVTRDPGDPLDAASVGRRVEAAAAWRRAWLGLPSDETTGYRIVHGEGDGLPGVVADVYGETLSVQFTTIGAKRRQEEIVGHLVRVTGCRAVVETSSERVARLEGFEPHTGVLRGPDVASLEFRERGLALSIPLEVAQKTGYYFDQRDNRARIEDLARDRTVLDAFSYVGAFALFAARGGARRIVAIDSSPAAIATGAALAARAGYGDRIEFVRADVRRALADMAAAGERFDVVVLDPPKLAPTVKDLEAGRKAYRRLNAAGLRLVRDGGLLVSCSCSAAMRQDDLQRTIGLAARDAGCHVAVLWVGQQAPDHPVLASFPEGRYLKCVVARVDR